MADGYSTFHRAVEKYGRAKKRIIVAPGLAEGSQDRQRPGTVDWGVETRDGNSLLSARSKVFAMVI